MKCLFTMQIDYLGVVRDSIAVTNSNCNDQIRTAVKNTEGLLRRRTGWWMIRKNYKYALNPCLR